MSNKLTEKAIETNIISGSKISNEEDFVALTVELDNNGDCYHSGLLICFDNVIKYFHYDSKKVELVSDYPETLYIKKLDIVSEELIASFMWHCEKLVEDVKPTYAWIFDGSYYDSKGEYYLKNSNHDMTTCVGFCDKVLTGFLGEKYLETEDWDIKSLDSLGEELKSKFLGYLKHIAEKNNLDYEELTKGNNLKRILPSEMFSSSFVNELPIRKVKTDEILTLIENYFIKRKAA